MRARNEATPPGLDTRRGQGLASDLEQTNRTTVERHADSLARQVVEWLDYEGAAKFLNLKLPTLRTLVHRRQIPHVRITGRICRFSLADLRAWLDERRVAVEGAGL